MEKKPNVFPEKFDIATAMAEANDTGTKIAKQANEELAIDVSNLQSKRNPDDLAAEEQMKQESLEKLEGQLKAREEFLRKKKEEALGGNQEETVNVSKISYGLQDEEKPKLTNQLDRVIPDMSSPDEEMPYDVITLPSEGLLYKNQKSTLKVAYLNAMDENIMTNPNLLHSGKFLEVLINRKMLDTELRYKDLHVGDRNAIMIWLRSTAYGPNYNIKLSDPKSPTFEEFEVEIDLSELKPKNLGSKPDTNGEFDYKLDITGSDIKFRLLTVGDIDDIEIHSEEMVEKYGLEYSDISTYTLAKQICEVDGNRDKDFINSFIKKIRLGDVRKLRSHINDIESGIDMNIEVRTPGGGSVNTFLPLNVTFFWPDL
tara:strand:+ start:26612 stop:27724 length:1113 start_codon:yes stop_codon:yes gene_type:complete